MPRDRALDEDQVLVGHELDDAEILDLHAVTAHAAGHPEALDDFGRIGGGADRTGRPQAVVLTVGLLHDTAEPVALDDTLEALPLAGADGRHLLALGEDLVDRDHVAQALADVEVAKLDQLALGGGARLLEVTLHGLGGVLHLGLAVGQLEGIIAVRIHRLDLRHDVGLGLDHRACHRATVLVEDAGHAYLFAYYSFHLSMIYLTMVLIQGLPRLTRKGGSGGPDYNPFGPLRTRSDLAITS